MTRDCQTLGHVRVGLDPECLACECLLGGKEHIGLHIPAPRFSDELSPESTATEAEWGHLNPREPA